MYVAVKGGEQAIDAAHRLLDEERRGDRSVPSMTASWPHWPSSRRGAT